MPEETPQQEVPQPQAAPTADSKDVEENKIWAVIAYIGILCLIPLLAKKDSPFAQFHAKQGTVLFIAEVGLYIVALILTFVTLGIGAILWPIVGLAGLVLAIIGIINAANGQMKELPVLGQFGKKLNL